MRDRITPANSIDPNGTGWQPFHSQFDSITDEQEAPRGQEQMRNETSGNGFVGRVCSFQTRQHQIGGGTHDIWTFRVIRYDESENRLPVPPIVVEMQGTAFNGFISDNDKVFVNEKFRSGQIVKTTSVFNITTGTTVVAKDPMRKWIRINQLMPVVGCGFILFVILAFVIIAILT